MRYALAIVLTAAVVGGGAGAAIAVALDGGTSTAQAAPATPVAEKTERGLTAEQIYRQAAPGVVVITDKQTEVAAPTAFAPPQREQVSALGSGFVIDNDGHILTNDHVVAGASDIRVGFSDGQTYPATVVGADPATDLAVVQVQAPASALHPLSFDDSSKAEVGDPVYAIGNPFGLDRTMTEGIVSALGRDIQAPDGETISDVIQTDAAINHGNSGGPLLDRFGKVIGVNSQIEGGTVDANVGVGFAISSDTAKSVADQLIAKGHVEHAWLGVEVTPVVPALSRAVPGMPAHGVAIARVVAGGPAAKAGLHGATRAVTVDGASVPVGGDVIVAIDGKAVTTPQELSATIAAHKPGDTIAVRVVRDGSTRTVDVTLGDVPAQS